MADVKKILGEYVSHEELTFGKNIFHKIKYKQPEGTLPDRVWEHQIADSDLSDTAAEILFSANTGERFCVHQGRNDKNFPIIVDITPASDAPKKEPYQKATGKGSWNKFAPRDDTGIAIGAAWTNAIEIAKLGTGTIGKAEAKTWKDLVDAIENMAWDIVQRKVAQEAKLKAAKGDKSAADEEKKEEAPMSREEKIKAKIAAAAAAKAKEEGEAKPVARTRKQPAPTPEPVEEVEDAIPEDNLDDIDWGE